MKKYICISLLVLVVLTGCKKDNYMLYSDGYRIQQSDTSTTSFTFFYEPATVVRDTIYIRVNTIGGISDKDRPVKLVQVPEYDITYKRDPVTNQITDTIKTEKPYKAVAGTHYIGFDDKAVAPLMIIKANKAIDSLPIILLRDASMKNNSWRLRVRLEANETFSLGESKAIEKTIVFSDRLERFYSWRVDNSTAPCFNFFGKYSTGKHEFMYNTAKVNIDEIWYQAIADARAVSHYQNLFKDALLAFNSDPANIASGKAPVREISGDPTSAAIVFP